MKNAYQLLQDKVEELAKELPGTTLGYIGNLERWGDDRAWAIFLPHPDRVGGYSDAVYFSGKTEAALKDALLNWDKYSSCARKLYFNGSVRY